MPKHLSIEKYSQLEKEKRLAPDYVNRERNAKKHGWKPKKVKKSKVKNKNNAVPKVKQSSYSIFLKSKYWKYVHNLVIDRDGKKCVKCGSVSRLQAHHLTYEHHYKEHLHLNDLITLCKKCHEIEHGL